jgi:flagellar protein FliO/FliZ
MSVKITLFWLMALKIPSSFAMTGTSGDSIAKPAARTIASGDIALWGMGLLIVLGVFFVCVWAVRKLNGSTVNDSERMRVVGGLSLGLREKVILLQVGKKQLVLGVTPGHIETLHVLENDDCLARDGTFPSVAGTGFAQKLMLATKVNPDA